VVIALAGTTIDSVCCQGLLDPQPKILIDDRGVLAWIGLGLMHDLAAIDAVLQHVAEGSPSNRLTPVRPAIRRCAVLADDAGCIEMLLKQAHRTQFLIAPEGIADGLSLGLVDDQLAVLQVVAERWLAAHPHPFLLGGSDLVANALASDLPLELGKGQQHVQRETTH
jgi:hypothetical protein